MASRTLRENPATTPVPAGSPALEALVRGQPDAPSETPDAVPAARSEADPAPAEAPDPAALSERDRALLAFEKQHWKYSGAKEQAIRDRFEMSATRYYQVLNALLDRPEAQRCEPVLVNRLRRKRAESQRARIAR
jgi:hypothetical protein